MKKGIFILSIIFGSLSTSYCEPSLIKADTIKSLPQVTEIAKKSDDLLLLGKLWGFLKYHHPNIIKGQFDWDQEMIKFLPDYIATKNITERNKLLQKWIQDLGTVPDFGPVSDTAFKNAKLIPDYNWINKSKLSTDIVNELSNLENNNSSDNQFYVKFDSGEGISLPTFLNEKSYSNIKNLTPDYKLLAVYRYWNIIEYWYPYKYLFKGKWDTFLKQFIEEALRIENENEYLLFIRKMAGTLKDTHATVNSTKIEYSKGKLQMPFTIKFIEGQAVVTSINASILNDKDIQIGNIIKSINGTPVVQLFSKVSPFISASNDAVLLREAAKLLTRTNDSTSNIAIIDNNNQQHELKVTNNQYAGTANTKVYDFTYQRDSTYFLLKENILYVNIGSIKRNQIDKIKPFLKTAKGIILDNRQYPKSPSGDLISELLLPHETPINLFSTLVKGYPGVFRYTKPVTIGSENPDYYKGKVVILVNEETQSTGEYFTMAFKLSPNAVIVGSATAGADGNVCLPFPLPGGIYTQITALGVYYPDRRETQQIGILPDVKINQSINGLRIHKDELLEKAISVITSDRL